jgi:hypothetical protein
MLWEAGIEAGQAGIPAHVWNAEYVDRMLHDS